MIIRHAFCLLLCPGQQFFSHVGNVSWVVVGDVYCIFVTFPCGILGQVWFLIVSFPDLCRLSYFVLNRVFCSSTQF